jgi:hypothetical protein
MENFLKTREAANAAEGKDASRLGESAARGEVASQPDESLVGRSVARRRRCSLCRLSYIFDTSPAFQAND